MKSHQNSDFIVSIICILISIIGMSLSICAFIYGKTLSGISLVLNSIGMIGNSIIFYYLWKRSKRSEECLNDINEMKNKNEDLKKYISSRFKSISEIELDPFTDTHAEIDSNQGGPMNAWRFNDDNESNIKHYTDLKEFKGLIIPKGITFVKHKYVENLVGDKRTPCDVLTNGGINVDPWEGVKCENKNCLGISCCDCIFFDQNADQRAEYFKHLQKGIN